MAEGNVAADQLRLLIERIERLEEEKKGVADDIKDVYAEAKATGFDTKTMRKVVGANIIKDVFASVSDFFGGRSGAYESSIQEARAQAMQEMEASARRLGADAILAVDFDY